MGGRRRHGMRRQIQRRVPLRAGQFVRATKTCDLWLRISSSAFGRRFHRQHDLADMVGVFNAFVRLRDLR